MAEIVDLRVSKGVRIDVCRNVAPLGVSYCTHTRTHTHTHTRASHVPCGRDRKKTDRRGPFVVPVVYGGHALMEANSMFFTRSAPESKMSAAAGEGSGKACLFTWVNERLIAR